MASSTTGLNTVLRPSQLREVLDFHESEAEPIIIIGPPGIGKSEQVNQVSKDNGRTTVYFDTSTADPTDLPGLPFPVVLEDGTRIVERHVFKKFIDNNPITVFADETFQGSPAVLNSVAPLFLEKRLGDIYMPPGTWVVGATNRPQDKAGTSRPPSHLPNRTTIVETAFELDDTRSHWMDKDMPIQLLGFAKYSPDSIFDFDPNRMVNATPRSWSWVGSRLSQLMQLSSGARLATIAGRVTEGHAAAFIGFCEIFDRLPSIEEAIMNPDSIPIPEPLDVRYAFASALSRAISEDNFDRLAILEQRMPRNIGVMMVNDAQRRDPAIKKTKAFVQWAIRNANVLL